MDCQQVSESTRLSSELYRDVIAVPFVSQVVVFAKRRSMIEAHLRIYCVTDDRLDKTLETREHYREVARSRGIEVFVLLFSITFLSFNTHSPSACCIARVSIVKSTRSAVICPYMDLSSNLAENIDRLSKTEHI